MSIRTGELLRKLGIDHDLSPYQTVPESVHMSGQGVTMTAEVRRGAEDDPIEAEILRFYDEPEPGKPPMELLFSLQLTWSKPDEWRFHKLLIKGEDWTSKFAGWDDKCLRVYMRCAQTMNAGELPDFDEIVEQEMRDDSFLGGGYYGGGGGRAPRVKGDMMGMKKTGF